MTHDVTSDKAQHAFIKSVHGVRYQVKDVAAAITILCSARNAAAILSTVSSCTERTSLPDRRGWPPSPAAVM